MILAIDGPEGAGKTTQAAMLIERINNAGVRKAIRIREPGGTIIGEKLRALLLDPSSGNMNFKTEVMLFMASRAQMYVEKVIPALAAGNIVIMDRWAWSTYAYQHGLSIEDFKFLVEFATGGVYPEISFIVDVPAVVGMERLGHKIEQSHGTDKDRFEIRSMQYHETVRSRYQELTYRFRRETRNIDGTQSVKNVHDQIMEHLKGRVL